MEKKKYELINLEGCLMRTARTTSFKKARELFNNEYQGQFRIICEGEEKNVRL